MIKRLLVISLVVGLAFTPLVGLATGASYEYLDTVAEMFCQFGEYPSWSVENKAEWLTALKRHLGDDPQTQNIDELLQSNSADKEHMIDEYLLSRYAAAKRAPFLNIHYCLIRELGPQHAWSLQQQAWVSQLYLKYYPDQWETWVGSMPEAPDITQEKAVQIAQAAFASDAGLPASFDWNTYVTRITFGVTRRNLTKAEPYYTVMFGELNDDPERLPYSVIYTCYISRDGKVLDIKDILYTPASDEP